MGFGKKMDYRNSREIDLDIIYKKVIKELFATDFQQYELIRADEICGSDIIDVSMYTLLIKADLVIADITTMNENALYELGVRHALKPFSTVVMMRNSEKGILFDLNHSRILTYDDFGEKLDTDEAKVIKDNLKKFISESEKQNTDSPFYTYLPQVEPPTLNDTEYESFLQTAMQREDTISNYIQKAESLKSESNFKDATTEWEKLHQLLPNNDYVTQQLAFSHYKSEHPNKTIALQNALEIINTLTPSNSLDLETLGITGAIYKNLYELNDNYDYLNEAIKMYKKGYVIKNDYYTGENYANCLLFKTLQSELSSEEIAYLKFESKKVYREVAETLDAIFSTGEINYWIYATLSACHYCLGNSDEHQQYNDLFLENTSVEWEQETYSKNLAKIKKCLEN